MLRPGRSVSSVSAARFARLPATVLDSAHGYQKENHEEIDEIKEDYQSEGDTRQEAGARAQTFQEISEEGCSQKARGQEEEFEDSGHWEGPGGE